MPVHLFGDSASVVKYFDMSGIGMKAVAKVVAVQADNGVEAVATSWLQ